MECRPDRRQANLDATVPSQEGLEFFERRIGRLGNELRQLLQLGSFQDRRRSTAVRQRSQITGVPAELEQLVDVSLRDLKEFGQFGYRVGSLIDRSHYSFS